MKQDLEGYLGRQDSCQAFGEANKRGISIFPFSPKELASPSRGCDALGNADSPILLRFFHDSGRLACTSI